MADPKQIVRAGYDAVSYTYRADNAADGPYRAWLAWLDPHLIAGMPVLDLGCGCGVPAARILAERYAVTGVDLSPVQIARAQALVPGAAFVYADMVAFDPDEQRYAAIVCLYAIIHVPLAEQVGLIERVLRWLRPGGLLLIMVGQGAWTGTEDDWLDVPGGTMYWSHAAAATYRTWLVERGCTLLRDEFIAEGTGGHTLLLVQHRNLPRSS